MTAHTPGPWKASGFSISAKGSGHIAKALEVYMDRTTREANARLIASAPDLLEALEAVIAISDRKHDAWDAAKAAIAKAKGEV
jgi:hypothetical protein